MIPQPVTTGACPRKIDAMLALLDELHLIIGEENRILAAGLPASLAQTVSRKTSLADQLDGWLAAMRRGELEADGTHPDELARLVVRLHSLRTLMGENTLAIKRSMEASRRRIDAIMRALRSESQGVRLYGPDAARQGHDRHPAGHRLA
jgi:flagellar biosynthesis/type III secretory pathway chaperone